MITESSVVVYVNGNRKKIVATLNKEHAERAVNMRNLFTKTMGWKHWPLGRFTSATEFGREAAKFINQEDR